MANNLFQQLNQNSQNNAQELLNSVRSSSNPQQMLLSIASKNPRVASILKEIQDNGGDAKSLFYKKAQQAGVNPETILSQLR